MPFMAILSHMSLETGGHTVMSLSAKATSRTTRQMHLLSI